MTKRKNEEIVDAGLTQDKKPADGAASAANPKLNADDVSKIKEDYHRAFSKHKSVLDEVAFILGERLSASGIKTHNIDKRVKELDSVVGKCERKGEKDISLLRDIVGARIICLFRTDMAQVGKIIEENFDVIEIDDKLAGHNSPLGYLSIHYLCKMPSRYIGPRYENTYGLIFEIQVRTLCMHAWAAVSHHLDYKGDWDVPAELQQALSALSGLFFVADREFEQFYSARLESKKRAEQAVGSSDQEINLDTVSVFLRNSFPSRVVDSDEVISVLVRDIKAAGYKKLSEVEADVYRARNSFEKYEASHPPSGKGLFTSIGAVRISLCLASDAFYEHYKKISNVRDPNYNDPMKAYRL